MLKQKARSTARRMLRSRGWDLVPFSGATSAAFRRNQLLEYEKINLVLDVGANVGQFGRDLRSAGFSGRMVSFEPLMDAFSELERRSSGDVDWDSLNLALSDTRGPRELHVSGNSVSSSLRSIRTEHTSRAPLSAIVRREVVSCETLDSIWPTIVMDGTARPYLKIDVQGHEDDVLAGAKDTLQHIRGIEIELSLVELYEGQSLFPDALAHMEDLGFQLFSLEPGFSDGLTGRVLQLDGIFVRKDSPVMRDV